MNFYLVLLCFSLTSAASITSNELETVSEPSFSYIHAGQDCQSTYSYHYEIILDDNEDPLVSYNLKWVIRRDPSNPNALIQHFQDFVPDTPWNEREKFEKFLGIPFRITYDEHGLVSKVELHPDDNVNNTDASQVFKTTIPTAFQMNRTLVDEVLSNVDTAALVVAETRSNSLYGICNTEYKIVLKDEHKEAYTLLTRPITCSKVATSNEPHEVRALEMVTETDFNRSKGPTLQRLIYTSNTTVEERIYRVNTLLKFLACEPVKAGLEEESLLFEEVDLKAFFDSLLL